ncbi:MAG: hypothetical protein WBZ19_28860 [Chthoniobacterales bacterium]
MKSYHLTYGGGIDSLVLREHEIPKPGLGEVLVRVRATSLNARELMILRGPQRPQKRIFSRTALRPS